MNIGKIIDTYMKIKFKKELPSYDMNDYLGAVREQLSWCDCPFSKFFLLLQFLHVASKEYAVLDVCFHIELG